MHYRLDSKKSSLVDRLADGIRCGLYPVGSRLPAERLLAERYEGSRTLVREALQELRARGVLVRGARQLSVHERALRLLEENARQATLRVVLVVAPCQIGNPIIQRIIATIADHLPADIHLSALCADQRLEPSLGQVGAGDMALVIGPHFSDSVLESIQRRCGALLVLNMPNPRFNFVSPDHYAGGGIMARHLWENHHTKIGAIYLGGSERNELGQRFDGAKDFLETKGLVLHRCEFERLDGSTTALLCPYDAIALSLYEQLAAKGMSVPGDISLIGFDDHFFSGLLIPPLTTVRYPAEAMGAEAASAVRQFQETGRVAIQKMVSPSLIQRESVRDLVPDGKITE